MSTSNDDLIKFHDANGVQHLVRREEYRTRMLPRLFKDAWNNVDALYNAIVMTLNDGFFSETIEPAKRLAQIDPIPERRVTVLGIVLMKNNDLQQAEQVLSQHLKNHRSGVVMTNLAKVYDEQGRIPEARAMLRNALTVDPNQDNALTWFGALAFENGGDDAFMSAMHDIINEPGSWRPQLWLARSLLKRGDLQSAMRIYQQVVKQPKVDSEVFTMISGDLGMNGYIEQAVDLLLPIFDAERFGIQAGLNLVNACIDSRRKAEGLKLCVALESLNRYDYKSVIDDMRAQLNAMK